MDRFKINFRLKELEEVLLWGEEPHQSIHWFGLTDGLLWIDVGEQTIYEYSEEAQRYFVERHPYNDYQLARFLEDFSNLFRYIGESVPSDLYDAITDFSFKNKINQWWDMYIDQPDEMFNQFMETDYIGVKWFDDRIMDSGYLIGGPLIGFFRSGDKLKIIWDSTYKLENGCNMWKSPCGAIVISYKMFVGEVTRFFHAFYTAMDRQVENAVSKDWGNVSLDKGQLVNENIERKEGFDQMISFLSRTPFHTNWDSVKQAYIKMLSEVGGYRETKY